MDETSFKVLESLTPALEYRYYVECLLGGFSEFFIHPTPRFAGFIIKGIEITFGEAPPLATSLFHSVYYEKYFGACNTIHSIRIYGLGRDDAEIYFANAAIFTIS